MAIRVISQLLFDEESIREVFDAQKVWLRSVISQAASLEGDDADLAERYSAQYRIVPPKIDLQDLAMEQKPQEKTIASIGPNPYIQFEHIPVDGKVLKLSVPFEGDPNALRYKPSEFSLDVYGRRGWYDRTTRRLGMEIEVDGNDPIETKRLIRQEFESLEGYLKKFSEEIEAFNRELLDIAKDELRKRRQKLTEHDQFEELLEIPIRRRENAPLPAVVPTKRSVPVISHQTSQSGQKHYGVDELTFLNILEIAFNMSRVLECSPKYFSEIQEETLRFHFLIQLNGQYKGTASAEAFNYEGKTDIMIKVEGKIAFIAECKFWDGPKEFKATIDQILGYLSWRDSKAAIFLFNRRKQTSKVLEQIPKLIQAHEHFVEEAPGWKSSTEYHSRFSHPTDKVQKLILAVCVFDVPAS